jgi:uncharacterized protein (TIGR02453 family)
MANFKPIYSFLQKLQKNNQKEWMDLNRKQYHEVRNLFIDWLDVMNDKLASIDDEYFDTPGKKAMNRINNNLMFHPNKPVYKDHFAAGLDQVSKQGDFYMEFGPNENFIGGGYWHPDSKNLRSIRDAIDYNGEEFLSILEKPSFKKVFGSLIAGDSLKTSPKGFDREHRHIELLRRKSFAVGCNFTKEQVLSDDFDKVVIHAYKEMLPFRRYLNEAISV